MKTTLYVIVLFFSFSCFSQEDKVPEYVVYNTLINTGEVLKFGGKAVKFKKVISDSRCPTGVTCIWAGEAKILIEFFENGKSQGERLIRNTKVPIAEFFNSDILNIRGFTLSPYPNVDKRINPEEYRISLRISEKIN